MTNPEGEISQIRREEADGVLIWERIRNISVCFFRTLDWQGGGSSNRK